MQKCIRPLKNSFIQSYRQIHTVIKKFSHTHTQSDTHTESDKTNVLNVEVLSLSYNNDNFYCYKSATVLVQTF